MRAFRISLFLATLAIAVIPCTAGAAVTCGQWAAVFEQGALPVADEILASLGAGDRYYPDELLGLDVREYDLAGADCAGVQTGKVYVSEGAVAGLSTVYAPGHRSRLGRFVLEYYDDILLLGELTAIAGAAGARENCAEYRAVAAAGEGEEVFRISAGLYEKMAAVGDLPPILAENARKGYAA